ncbi:MAG: hypothetical protein QM529_06335 [Hydrotalea sp.]|nr:hypothetical protein [Hydrotalea sp.]
MKIAVEISGHLRTFEFCAPLLRRYLLDRYDCDVFIHTWDKTEHQNRSWHGNMGMGDGQAPQAVDDTMGQKIMAMYQPKAITIDSEEALPKIDGFLIPPRPQELGGDGFGGFTLQAVWNTLYTESQAHSIMRQYQAEHGTHYDFIIRTRPDIGLLEPFVIEPYLPFFKMCDDTAMFFPSWIYVRTAFDSLHSKDYERFLPGSMDVFYLTTPGAMDKLMSIMDPANFQAMFIDTPACFPTPDWQTRWSVELLFLWYAQRLGIIHHFGKINRIIKRNRNADDTLVVHKDRVENSREHLVMK